jgi:hypothetical protein
MTRSYIIFALLIVLVTAVVGCSDGEQLQLDIQKALAKHTEMNTYRFSGSTDLSLERPEGDWSTNPMTARIASMITNGKLTWEGVASVNPVRMEMQLQIIPNGSTQPIEIPMLIQNNKMYVHIPAINQPEQYYEIDLEQLSEMSGAANSLSPQQLGNAGQLFSSLFHDIISAVNPKRFEDEASDETAMKSILITLKQKHVEEAIGIWFNALPEIINQLSSAGYIQQETLESWQQKLSADHYKSWIDRSDAITLNQPLILRMKIDDQGFIRESHIYVDITMTAEDQTLKTWSADIVNRYDDINQNPPFTRPIPDNVKPFTDILKLLTGNSNP